VTAGLHVGRGLSLWAGVSDTGTDEALFAALSVPEGLPALSVTECPTHMREGVAHAVETA
jgi:hypothetical protein